MGLVVAMGLTHCVQSTVERLSDTENMERDIALRRRLDRTNSVISQPSAAASRLAS